MNTNTKDRESKISITNKALKKSKGSSKFIPLCLILAFMFITAIGMLLIITTSIMNLIHTSDNWLFEHIEYTITITLVGGTGVILSLSSYLGTEE